MFGGFSIWHWLIVLAVVVLVFGTKKLRNVGGDLGAAIKSFRQGLNVGQASEDSAKLGQDGAKTEQAEPVDRKPEQTQR